jgi:hypothetical protein
MSLLKIYCYKKMIFVERPTSEDAMALTIFIRGRKPSTLKLAFEVELSLNQNFKMVFKVS